MLDVIFTARVSSYRHSRGNACIVVHLYDVRWHVLSAAIFVHCQKSIWKNIAHI